MPMATSHHSQHDAASRIASALGNRSHPQITAHINDSISRAYLIDDEEARTLALDFHAELVTALRELHIWPRKRGNPCQ